MTLLTDVGIQLSGSIMNVEYSALSAIPSKKKNKNPLSYCLFLAKNDLSIKLLVNVPLCNISMKYNTYCTIKSFCQLVVFLISTGFLFLFGTECRPYRSDLMHLSVLIASKQVEKRLNSMTKVKDRLVISDWNTTWW